nr:immunoglobulin light chain junction region [Macaca mulatta]MOW60713.1 immunoglobulin light chain junction region [Macaca mulatta]MOW61442.1 immunoglobulin light chain junction region [Macaca mulatta]MOW66166.1 immunoglobulin light chain junction region [Macaca mulatta]MOW66283.1 immunoglobulin light chain junction region [Macaca mulatta]
DYYCQVWDSSSKYYIF